MSRLVGRKFKWHYLPLWFAAAIAVVCMIIGVTLGMQMKNDNASVSTLGGEESSSAGTSTAASRVDKTKWNLILVNRWNPVPDNYKISLKYLDNGHAVDERVYSDLEDMLSACRAEGLEPIVCSSYRTADKQKMLYNNKINEFLGYGYSKKEAERKAGELVAIPGTSEHQLGLALDIVDISNQTLDESQENTPAQKWLMENSWKYGFILRYPTKKSNITGISYEPWHYRYVGKDDAEKIYKAKICLEEYLK